MSRHEDTPKIVMNVFRQMAATFAKATAGAWLTRKQLGIDEAAIAGFVTRIMGNLCHAEMLERSTTKEKPPRAMYRPTEAGWTLLRSVLAGAETDEGLYQRFGAVKPLTQKGRCSTCTARIHDRRSHARVCWGCAEPAVRVVAGKDHLPRPGAYYKGMIPAYVREDKARIRAARKALKAAQDAVAVPVARHGILRDVASRPGRKLSHGRTFDDVMVEARQFVAARGGWASVAALQQKLGVSTTVVQKVTNQLRAERIMTKVYDQNKKVLVPIQPPTTGQPAAHAETDEDQAVAALAQLLGDMRKDIRALAEKQGELVMDLASLRDQIAKREHTNGVSTKRGILAAVMKQLEKPAQ